MHCRSRACKELNMACFQHFASVIQPRPSAFFRNLSVGFAERDTGGPHWPGFTMHHLSIAYEPPQ